MNSSSSSSAPHRFALGAKRRDERAHHDDARIDEQPRDLADAADVLDAVGGREAEILVEAVTHVVAIEQVGMAAVQRKPAFDQIGDGRLSGAGQPGEPHDARALRLQRARTSLVTVSGCQ